jgi:hypothetical protein
LANKGASRTLLFAEKYLSVGDWETGADHGDDWSMYTGYQDDVHRTTYLPPLRDGAEMHNTRFGSSHPSTWNMSFCDASVRALSFHIDPQVHRGLGNRNRGTVFDESELR